jgi:flagellar hook-associated protein 2
MLSSIAAGLGIGSGIDTKTLVSELAANARGARETQIVAKERGNAARISVVATLKAGLDSLATDYADSAATTAPADLKVLAKSFVSGFNLLRTSLNDSTRGGSTLVAAGALAGDPAGRALSYAFNGLPQAELATTGTYRTLSDIGIGVSRTGALTFDSAKFDAALAAQPTEVAALLTGSTGLSAALKGLRDRMTSSDGPLGIASARYESVATGLAKQRERMEADNAKLVDRLTKSFGGMDQQVARLKAVQSYVEQQVAAWNSK